MRGLTVKSPSMGGVLPGISGGGVFVSNGNGLWVILVHNVT
jgi:hypothetical protein